MNPKKWQRQAATATASVLWPPQLEVRVVAVSSLSPLAIVAITDLSRDGAWPIRQYR
jgi:hypothetical protein